MGRQNILEDQWSRACRSDMNLEGVGRSVMKGIVVYDEFLLRIQ